ncbi:hypothetical protein [Aeromonas veronii]
MDGHYINLFMWGYQSHYRIQIQRLARDVLKRLGGSFRSGNDSSWCSKPK